METLFKPDAWIALSILVLLEIVLGIDNLLFLSIISGKLPKERQASARTTGLVLAMLFRIGLLFSISWVLGLQKTWMNFDLNWIKGHFSGQNLILLLGSIFLIYKSVNEIHHKLENIPEEEHLSPSKHSFWGVIIQIILLDMIFSIDSILTAIGLISLKEAPEGFGYIEGFSLIILAIIVTVVVMLVFSGSVSRFIHRHPSIQILGLSFLLLIGVMLLLEAAHLGNFSLGGNTIQAIPKGYLYFAIFFALLVEVLNMKRRKHSQSSKCTTKTSYSEKNPSEYDPN
ncbi:MAG: TerC family protein [Flavobacteriales bacterium AspAUS03]